MPTYEYRCQDCGATVEVVQSFKDEPLTICGVCGGRLRRVFHPVGIVLKGSGFYATDSRSGSKSGPKREGEGASSPSSDGASTSTSSKGSDGSSKGSGGGSSTGSEGGSSSSEA